MKINKCPILSQTCVNEFFLLFEVVLFIVDLFDVVLFFIFNKALLLLMVTVEHVVCFNN